MGRLPALVISRKLRLSPEEIHISFIHASGPGGQHVNKVATAAQLRFAVDASPSLPPEVKQRLRQIAGRRINKSGELVITARSHRSQLQNRDDALGRLQTLIQRAARPPPARIPTRTPASSKRRRLDAKTRRGKLKANRRRPGPDD